MLNLSEMSSIWPRLPRSRRDLWRSPHDVCEFLNLGEIAARFPPSRRDCRDLAMMFVGFSNLGRVLAEIGKILPRLAKSCREAGLLLYLTEIL